MIAAQLRSQLLLEERSFCFEAVFSHPSKIDFVGQAKALGYEIILVFIHLDSVSLNQERISQRVSEGGHSVPDEKVRSRISRLLKLIKQTLPLCDQCYLLDNSRADNPFKQVAIIRNGKTELKRDSIPEWARELLADYLLNADN